MCSSFTRIQLADPLKDSNSGNRARRVFRTEGVDDLAEGGENMEKLSERVSREADSFLRKVFFSYFLSPSLIDPYLNGLTPNSLRSIFQDREGNYWIES